MPSASPFSALAARLRTNASSPLWTHYSPDSARVELSTTTAVNWADKVAWFLDEEGLAGERVQLEIARERPLHWMTLSFTLGCWLADVTPTLASADVAFCSPTQAEESTADLVIVGSLTPFGLPVPGLAARFLDFADVRTQPDQHHPALAGRGFILFEDDEEHPLEDLPEPSSERRIVEPGTAWEAMRDALLAPILGGGSVVLVEGGDVARIAGAEKALR